MIIEGPAEEVRPTSTHGQPTESESTGTPFQDTPTSTVRVVRNKYALFTKQPHILVSIPFLHCSASRRRAMEVARQQMYNSRNALHHDLQLPDGYG